MNRLVNPINPRLPIRNSHQTRTRQESQTARNHAGLITDDISKQITRHHNPIQLRRLLDHNHRRTINKLVLPLQAGKLVPHDLLKRLAPQPTRRQHIRLIQTRDFRGRVFLQSQFSGKADHAHNLIPTVWLGIHCVAGAVVFGALAKVDAAGEFADDVEVNAGADGFFQGGGGDEGGCGEEAGAQVAEGLERFAEFEEALFGPDFAGAPFLDGERGC